LIDSLVNSALNYHIYMPIQHYGSNMPISATTKSFTITKDSAQISAKCDYLVVLQCLLERRYASTVLAVIVCPSECHKSVLY